MAADTHLPSIQSLLISKRNDKGGSNLDEDELTSRRKAKTSSFLSRLQLGSLQKLPQPGDVYYGPSTAKKPRPLGLIPNRDDKMAALKRLNHLLSPWAFLSRPTLPDVPPSTPLPSVALENSRDQKIMDSISGTVCPEHVSPHTTAVEKYSSKLTDPRPYHYPKSVFFNEKGEDADPDYMDAMTREYYYASSKNQIPPLPLQALKRQPLNLTTQKGSRKKSTRLQRNFHTPISRCQYMNFTGQVQLFRRNLTDDRREALDYEPCERCRLRGGRCARCKAIRTGGGYIILDGGEDGNIIKRSHGYEWAPTDHSGVRRGVRNTGLEVENSSMVDGSGIGLNQSDNITGGTGEDRGEVVRKGETQQGGHGGPIDGNKSLNSKGEPKNDIQSSRSQDKQVGNTVSEEDYCSGIPADDGARHQPTQQRDIGGTDGNNAADDQNTENNIQSEHSGLWEESGRQSQTGSRLTRSRPSSTLGSRPSSSIRRLRKEPTNRKRTGVDLEKQSGREGVWQGGGVGESDGEDNGDDSRRRKKRSRQPGDTTYKDKGHETHVFKELNYRHDDDDEGQQSYRGNLMKFKKRQDDVKALQATLKELQGIDPLDYLAKYCIIDQSKLPHYQHVYNNVDRDEDDEIDIGELDFALKAVNYDLISDTEMNYVHSVLELAGRYKLNFRLFSLIAALSEKVVALEDMVKRLINKMDFDALEVKMKKCKELFYLLADSNASSVEHEGGVVTTGSLAVELQAGGLTQGHVEFVVDRLNHEGRGLVEFLDYLTYVPLFVEIHDSISENPLNFSRTK